MIEFISVALLLFAVISAGIVVVGGLAKLFSLVFDKVQEKFGDDIAIWVSAVIYVAFVSALISGLMLIGDGSGAQ